MIANLLIALLIAVQGFIGDGIERKVTFYWALVDEVSGELRYEDGWRNLVADPACPNPPDESWGWHWCAVNDLKTYPFGTVLYIEGLGFWCVHDHCPQPNTIDLRVPVRRMERHYRKAWVIWRGGKR